MQRAADPYVVFTLITRRSRQINIPWVRTRLYREKQPGGFVTLLGELCLENQIEYEGAIRICPGPIYKLLVRAEVSVKIKILSEFFDSHCLSFSESLSILSSSCGGTPKRGKGDADPQLF